MKSPAPLELVATAAQALEELRSSATFLGGAITGLLITDPAAQQPRATFDVDVAIQVASLVEYHSFEKRLRAKGFLHSLGGPICRFERQGVVLDVLPDQAEILGFSNPWYPLAIERASRHALTEDIEINVIDAPCFLATKLAAFDSDDRENHGDMLASRDFEDIVHVIDGREELGVEIQRCPTGLETFLRHRLKKQLEHPRIHEGIEAHAEYGRVAIILERITRIAAP